jgi:hypothetical protein
VSNQQFVDPEDIDFQQVNAHHVHQSAQIVSAQLNVLLVPMVISLTDMIVFLKLPI